MNTKKTLTLAAGTAFLSCTVSNAATVDTTYTLSHNAIAVGGAGITLTPNHSTFLTDTVISTDWADHSTADGSGNFKGGWWNDTTLGSTLEVPTITISFASQTLLETFSISYLTNNLVGIGSPDSYKITIGGVQKSFTNSTDLTDSSLTEVIDLSTEFSALELTNQTGMIVTIVADNTTAGNTNETWIGLSEYSVTSVPEPSSAAALLGFASLALILRRRK